MYRNFSVMEIKSSEIHSGKVEPNGSMALYLGSGAIERIEIKGEDIIRVGVTNYCDYVIVLADGATYEVTGDNLKKIGV